MTTIASDILSNPKAFLQFMKDNRYTIVHQSNVFYRDIQFAIAKYIEAKTGQKVKYFATIEGTTNEVCEGMIKAGVLRRLTKNTFVVDAPEFMLPRPEPAPAPAKPAAVTA